MSSQNHRRRKLRGRFEVLEPRFMLASVGLSFTGTTRTDLPPPDDSVPDTMGGVGPSHIVELLDRTYAVYDKADGALVVRSDADDFWNAALEAGGGGSTVLADDPRIIYDHDSERWFAIAAADYNMPSQHIIIAVSNSADPTDGWKAFEIDVDPTDLYTADFPRLGVDADGVYVQASLFDWQGDNIDPPLRGNLALISVPKSDLLGSTPTVSNATVFPNLNPNDPSNPRPGAQPTIDFGPSNGRHAFLSYGGPDFVRNDIHNAAGTGPATLTERVRMDAPYSDGPPRSPQPETSTLIHSGHGSMRANTFKQGDSIWLTRGERVDGRAGIRWLELHEPTNTVLQTGTIGHLDLSLYYPSIAANGFGDVVIGFSASSSTQFPSAYAIAGATINGVTTFGDFILLKAGIGPFFGDPSNPPSWPNWGNYSATVLDPENPRRFWTFQEFTSATDQWGIQVAEIDTDTPPPGLIVWSIVPSSTGFVAEFNRELDSTTLNLYDTELAQMGIADVSLVGSGGPVSGSLIIDPSLQRIRFVKTGGPLAPDSYTVTLRSGIDGFTDTVGNTLDGDSDRVGGDSFTTTFTVDAFPDSAVVLSLPDISRGAGQQINLPAETSTGIPLTIDGPAGVREISLEIAYDPTVLRITDGFVGPAMPDDATATVIIPKRDVAAVLANPNRRIASVSFSSPTGLPAGTSDFAQLGLKVLPGVPFDRKLGGRLLEIVVASITDGSGNSFPVVIDDGLHLTSYVGDVSGNGSINAVDASQVARVAGLIDSGFAGSLLTDPILMGDVTGNGRINASDASKAARFAAQLQVPEIPTIPAETVTIFDSAADPTPNNVALLSNIVSDFVWTFHRFEVESPTDLATVGAVFAYDAVELMKVFAAVVQLSGPDDSPDSLDLTTPDVLGTTLITLSRTPLRGETFTAELAQFLAPGWYAVVFGTGAFGASTNVARSNHDDQLIFIPSHFTDLAPTQSPVAILRPPESGILPTNTTPRILATAKTSATRPLSGAGRTFNRFTGSEIDLANTLVSWPAATGQDASTSNVDFAGGFHVRTQWPRQKNNHPGLEHAVDVVLSEERHTDGVDTEDEEEPGFFLPHSLEELLLAR